MGKVTSLKAMNKSNSVAKLLLPTGKEVKVLLNTQQAGKGIDSSKKHLSPIKQPGAMNEQRQSST